MPFTIAQSEILRDKSDNKCAKPVHWKTIILIFC